jgi:uncharacterized protein (DUF924 family)
MRYAITTRALKLTHLVLERGWDRTYSIEELVFALMPLRHTPTIERLVRVLSLVDEYGLPGPRDRWVLFFKNYYL